MINRDTLLCISLAGRPGNFGTRFHNYLYDKLGLNYLYKAFTTKDIEAAVKGVRALGIRGCAVSMPFKESCIPFLDAVDPSAKVIDSVNTIVNDDGKLTGLNTDYIAVKSLIASHRLDTNARVMIQGSGGMGKAVIAAFRDAGFRDVIIAARNRQRGLALAKQYGFQWQPLPEGIAAEILVNVTPLGMAGGAESNTLAFSEAMVAHSGWPRFRPRAAFAPAWRQIRSLSFTCNSVASARCTRTPRALCAAPGCRRRTPRPPRTDTRRRGAAPRRRAFATRP